MKKWIIIIVAFFLFASVPTIIKYSNGLKHGIDEATKIGLKTKKVAKHVESNASSQITGVKHGANEALNTVDSATKK